jgi:hypothetical protein
VSNLRQGAGAAIARSAPSPHPHHLADWFARKLAIVMDPSQPLAERQAAWVQVCHAALSLEPRLQNDVVVSVRKEGGAQ